jgi:DNA modification methylase
VIRLLQGDCRDVLAKLPAASVHCCVTSPPYFGLRDYGCDGQIGLEATPEAFVAELVAVFREVRRVLRDDGTLWLNLGDSYAASTKGAGGAGKQHTNAGSVMEDRSWRIPQGLKPKDLIGIPWRVAFALQADGWYLRQDIIWSKPNPMPESVTDRCTKAHEYLFLLSKSPTYFCDMAAIAEPVTLTTIERMSQPNLELQEGSDRVPGKTNGPMKAVTKKSGNTERKPATERGCPVDGVSGSVSWEGTTRNKRSVWTVTTQPFAEAHFATFPPLLIEPCIKAGCPEGGTVLDPFGGAGTTGLVADRLQRDAVLIELNPAYAQIAERRIVGDAPLFAEFDMPEPVATVPNPSPLVTEPVTSEPANSVTPMAQPLHPLASHPSTRTAP